MSLSSVGQQNFAQEVLQASGTMPVLVDFWAPWCGPCRALSPVLEQLAAQTPGLKVVKLNTDEEPALATQYAIRSIPAVKLFRDGKVVDEFVGAQPLVALKAFVARHLPKEFASELDLARQARQQGDLERALKALESLRAGARATEPDSEVESEYAHCLALDGKPEEAHAVLRDLPLVAHSEPTVKRAQAIVYFARLALSPDETDAIQTARVAAARQLLHGRTEGLEQLLQTASRNRRYASEAGRNDLLQAFELLADDTQRVADARRRLAALLH